MAGSQEPRMTAPALPGLNHLCGQVKHWDAAVRTLSFTATAIAESVAASGSAPQSTACTWKPAVCAQDRADPSRAPPPALAQPGPRTPLPPAAPTLVVSASQLKPGRVFVVANLQGAYYTLLELLSRHKFDFRSDNLLHLGNLVALPAPLGPPPPPPAAAAVSAAAAATAASGLGGALPPTPTPPAPQPPQQLTPAAAGGLSRRLRNSAAVLKLFRRHGGLGPMGGNECLTVLAAARSNRVRAEQRAEEERRLAGLLEQQQQRTGGGPAVARGRCSALSMQLAQATATAQGPMVVAAAAAAVPPSCAPAATAAAAVPVPLQRCRTPAAWLAASDSSEESSDESDDEEEDCEHGPETDVEMVAAPPTPLRDETSPAAFPFPGCAAGEAAAAAAAPAGDAGKAGFAGPPPAAGLGFRGGGGGRPSPDDADMVQLLSLPACVVLEPYGVQLVHAAGTPGHELRLPVPGAGAVSDPQPGPYHTLFSHRRPGGCPSASASASPWGPGSGSGSGSGTSATATGLSSSRDVVRFAVLPPLRTLQRRSPGFPPKVAAALAPSREDLMLQVLEEPLSELDA